MATWGFGFMVRPGQDRAQRYLDATESNPSITGEVQADADSARDSAFAYVDNNSINPPYQIIANGLQDPDTLAWSFHVEVTPLPPEPEE